MSDRRVSVVIPNFNGEALLPTCLAALESQSRPPDEIVVADNASADGSLELLAARHPEVTAIALDRNYGFAGGANRGVLAATHPLVCVLNSDARPQADWLERLLEAVQGADDDVWCWGSILVSPSDGTVESAGDQWDDMGYAYKLGQGSRVEDLPDEPYTAFAAPGAAALFRRDRFAALGGYHERYFLYYEDVDLAYRALLRGWRAQVVPRARVEHDLGGSSQSRAKKARVRFYVARNSLWTAIRCIPEPSPGLLFLNLRLQLWRNRPRHLIPVELAGRLAALKSLPRVLEERRAIQAARALDPETVRRQLAKPDHLGR